MTIINSETFATISSADFQNRKPFPWTNIQGFLTDRTFEELLETLPPPSMLHSEFGKARGYGQQSHDRLSLQYRPGLNLSPVWQEFIDYLHGSEYEQFIRRMYGLKASERIVLTMHWHYAKAGCSVSPHVDASRKLGSHIFYFHRSDEWDDTWGGQTVVLESDKPVEAHSAPSFDAFNVVAASKIMDNHSFIFHRTENSWHGVRPLTCPPERLRKVFIVVVNRVNLQVRWRALRGKDADGIPFKVKQVANT
ncbi:MAG: 2OG-Fe(II) oxygenase [Candidatus Obscuribacterales bacterium]